MLCIMLASSAAPSGEPLHPPAGARSSALDSLASVILELGSIPSGGRLLVLSSLCGWPARTTSVSFTSESELWVGGFSGAGDSWGFAGSPGGQGVLVTSLTPSCIPHGLPLEVGTGGRVGFSLETSLDPALLTLSVALPDDSVLVLNPDSAGIYVLDAVERGVYWIEASNATASGPEVVMLLPLLSGVTVQDAMGKCMGMREPSAWTLAEVASAFDSIRTAHGLEPARRSALLDSIAGCRASDIAMAGRVSHSGLDSIALPEGLPAAENIGRGRTFSEALSMILTSPAHLSSCLSTRWESAGWGARVQVERDGWQVVLVGIMCEGSP